MQAKRPEDGREYFWEDREVAAKRSEMTQESARVLLSWYDENKRSLPWREDPSPYHVWLSEIMLQQTRVEAVLGYYRRFLAALPDTGALAAAPEDQYLKLWEGLGYYSRVRNLHKAAVMIVEDFGGKMPETSEALRRLPGIGAYTAAAIASIAFGEPVPAVDGNLLRIFARLTLYDRTIKDESAKKAAEAFYRSFIPADRPGDFNQSLMDLGATLCLPNGEPLCGACPLSGQCLARREGRTGDIPVKTPKKERRVEEKTVFVIRRGKGVLIGKRPNKGLLAGLYEFPNAEGHLDMKEAARFVQSLGFEPVRLVPLPGARHVFSHVEWHMTGYDVLVDEAGDQSSGYFFAADAESLEDTWSIPSAFAAYERIVLASLSRTAN